MKKTSKFICFIILCSILTCAVFLCGCSKKQPNKSTEHDKNGDCSECGTIGQIKVQVFVDGVYTQTLYTDLEYNYKIIEPTKPEYTPSTNPNSEKYFYGWFTDPNFQTPLTANTTFRSDSAIYGKWITAYSNEFTYTVDSGIATITGVVGSPTVLVIPSYINSFPVKAITENAFKNNTKIKSVVICNGIETIRGFENCNSMTDVQMPKSVKTISARCFAKCGLTRVTIPNGVTSIGSEAFSYCNELTKVTIPNGVTDIGSKTFYGCGKLTDVTIGNGVTSIDESAFEDCVGLTRITIGNGVTSIGSRAFYGCNKLTGVTIGNGVTTVGSNAFSNCNELTSITLPNGVATIDSLAFHPCSKLTSISIPNTITYIGDYAFGKRNKLTTIIYRGTTAQWHDIRQNSYYMGNYTIECKDGTINY